VVSGFVSRNLRVSKVIHGASVRVRGNDTSVVTVFLCHSCYSSFYFGYVLSTTPYLCVTTSFLQHLRNLLSLNSDLATMASNLSLLHCSRLFPLFGLFKVQIFRPFTCLCSTVLILFDQRGIRVLALYLSVIDASYPIWTRSLFKARCACTC